MVAAVHERPAATADAPSGDTDGAGAVRNDTRREDDRSEDPELAAYNDYLARLAEQDRDIGALRVPGGGLEPPTSGSKGRRSAD